MKYISIFILCSTFIPENQSDLYPLKEYLRYLVDRGLGASNTPMETNFILRTEKRLSGQSA